MIEFPWQLISAALRASMMAEISEDAHPSASASSPILGKILGKRPPLTCIRSPLNSTPYPPHCHNSLKATKYFDKTLFKFTLFFPISRSDVYTILCNVMMLIAHFDDRVKEHTSSLWRNRCQVIFAKFLDFHGTWAVSQMFISAHPMILFHLSQVPMGRWAGVYGILWRGFVENGVLVHGTVWTYW